MKFYRFLIIVFLLITCSYSQEISTGLLLSNNNSINLFDLKTQENKGQYIGKFARAIVSPNSFEIGLFGSQMYNYRGESIQSISFVKGYKETFKYGSENQTISFFINTKIEKHIRVGVLYLYVRNYYKFSSLKVNDVKVDDLNSTLESYKTGFGLSYSFLLNNFRIDLNYYPSLQKSQEFFWNLENIKFSEKIKSIYYSINLSYEKHIKDFLYFEIDYQYSRYDNNLFFDNGNTILFNIKFKE